MSAHVMYEGRRYTLALEDTEGKQYAVVIEDTETGERYSYPEAYYYGTDTDATDFTLRFSMLPPDERDEKRAAL